jgi:hypothetical protein
MTLVRQARCLVRRHDWQVICSDDDGCKHCPAVRLWPSGQLTKLPRS